MFQASIITVNFNGWCYLEKYIPSLLNNKGDYEIIISDNDSKDGSVDNIRTHFPNIILLANSENLGFAEANNQAARDATGEFLVFINPDTILDSNMLATLLEPFIDPSVGLVTSKILLMQKPDQINTCGNVVHISGITLCRGLGEPLVNYPNLEEIDAVSGAAFAIRRQLFEQLGGFDKDFFMYMEETDLSIRARIAGWKCVYQPRSIIYHDYQLKFSPRKVFFQERNRYLLILKNFRWTTMFVMLPTLLLAEIITWGFSIIHGWNDVRNKLDAYHWILSNWSTIYNKRRKVQSLRRATDREIIKKASYKIDFRQVSGKLISTLSDIIFNTLFGILKLINLVVIWW